MATLHEDVCTFTIIPREFFLELKMFQTKAVEEIKTHFVSSNFTPDFWPFLR
jgi:hypothetical protein